MAVAQETLLPTPPAKSSNAARTVRLTAEGGEGMLAVPLLAEDGREYAVVMIDGVRYHLERMTTQELVSDYQVDRDPDYAPQADKSGHCFLMVPFSQ